MSKKVQKKTSSHKKDIKEHSKVASKKPAKKCSKTIWIVSIVLAVLIIAAGAYFLFGRSEKVLATVNGEKILASEVAEWNKFFAVTYGSEIPADFVLNQTVLEKVLVQEAAKKGIVVSDMELDSNIETSLAKKGGSIAQYEEILKQQNLSYSWFRERVRAQMAIAILANSTTLEIAPITDAEVKAFYDQNAQIFANQKFDAAKVQIALYLKSQKQQEAFQKYAQSVRDAANVVINN